MRPQLLGPARCWAVRGAAVGLNWSLSTMEHASRDARTLTVPYRRRLAFSVTKNLPQLRGISGSSPTQKLRRAHENTTTPRDIEANQRCTRASSGAHGSAAVPTGNRRGGARTAPKTTVGGGGKGDARCEGSAFTAPCCEVARNIGPVPVRYGARSEKPKYRVDSKTIHDHSA